MERIALFLEEDLEKRYQELLPSRWSQVVPRLCKCTQQLRSCPLSSQKTASLSWSDELSLVKALLEEEQSILAKGCELLIECRYHSPPSSRGLEILEQLLNHLLEQLALKESIYAEWQRHPAELSSDLMRVYAHALIAASTCLTKNEVNRTKMFFRS